jgi:RimJ/RimL family protein N-acetyltransferase
MQFAERQTERLTCRRPRGRDARHYRALLLDDEVAARLFPAPLPRYGRRDAAKLLRADVEHWNEHRFGPWVLTDRETGAFVGRGGLAWTTVEGRSVVELPWSLLPERWNEGLATEAARAALDTAHALGLNGVVAFTLADNHASQRVMEKIGLERAGEIEHAGLPHVLFRDSARRAP